MPDFGSRQFRSVGILVDDVNEFDCLENFFDSSFEGIEFAVVNELGRSKNGLSCENFFGSSFGGIEFTAVNGFARFENFLDSTLEDGALFGAVNESGLSTNGLSGENFIGSFLGIAFECLPPRPILLPVAFPFPFVLGVGWN